jgi:DNA-binding MarR family transcriptional regulator
MSKHPSPLRAVLDLTRLYRERLEALSRKHGHSRARFVVLQAARGGRSVPQIARSLGLARQSVQRIADALAESGLVRYQVNPAHERSPLLELTDSGAQVADRMEQEIGRWEAAAVATLEAEEVDALLLSIETLRDGLER